MLKLAMLLPTNKPEIFKEVFFKSLGNIKEALSTILFSINFQPPWTKEEIELCVKAMQALGCNVKWQFNCYEYKDKGSIPFNKIRSDCAIGLDGDFVCYGLCDDDFEFRQDCGQMLLDVINCFEEDERLGVMQCKAVHPIIPLIFKQVNPTSHVYFTDQGFFFRAISGYGIMPSDAIDNIGAGEESVIGMSIAAKGYKVAFRTCSKINHRRGVMGQANLEWGKEEILWSEKGNNTYLRKKYGEFYQ